MAAFTKTFTTNDFTNDTETGKLKLYFSASTINLGGGMGIRLSKLLRNINGGYENVIVDYKIDPIGNMTIYSDEAFAGMLVITSDE